MPAPRRLLAVAAGVGVALLLLLAAELAARLLLSAPEWPSADKRDDFAAIRMDPILGALARPGWSGFWFGGFAVRIDDRGFRATGLPPPPAPRRRVAFVGDSCTFGWGVASDESFVGRLDAAQRAGGAAPQTEFINAAYPGQSAVVGEQMLRDKVLPLRPDVVVIAFGANNAFRFSVAADADRFRRAGLRRWLLRSRLAAHALARLARNAATGTHPRDRQLVLGAPVEALQRVADPDAYRAALRAMIADARGAGARVVLLNLPRAALLSELARRDEDAAASPPLPDARPTGARFSPRELTLFEATCLDHRAVADPPAALREGMKVWQPVYPDDPALREALRDGAAAFVRGDLDGATRRFAAAVAAHPHSPLAHYDLGVARLAAGDPAGLDALREADRLACNVFLHYQVAMWEVGLATGAPVVDATLWFQAHAGEELFLDPAHPTAAGHAIIAEALAPALEAVR